MEIKNSDLKALFLALADQEFLDVPAEKSLHHHFSSNFVKWGKEMAGQQSVITSAKTFKQIARIVLIAALVAALLAGTALAFPAVRDLVKKFFVRQTESNAHYIDFGDYSSSEPCVEYTETTEIAIDNSESISNIEIVLRAEAELSGEQAIPSIERRSPMYYPPGLKVVSETFGPAHIATVLLGPGELMCHYIQSAHPSTSNVGVAIALGDDYAHSEEIVCDTLMSVFRSKTTIVFIWDDEDCLYRLLVNAGMPMKEVEKIIYSIAPRDDLNNP